MHNKDVDAWLEKAKSSDGMIIVTPEYNNIFSSAIKNALEYFNVVDIPAQLYFPRVNELFDSKGKLTNSDVLRGIKDFNK